MRRPDVKITFRGGPIPYRPDVEIDGESWPCVSARINAAPADPATVTITFVPNRLEVVTHATATKDTYLGTFCVECGWDASHHPPEVTCCFSCGGDLIERHKRS